MLLPSSQLYSDSVGSQPAESRTEPLLPRELGSRPTGLLAMAAAGRACVPPPRRRAIGAAACRRRRRARARTRRGDRRCTQAARRASAGSASSTFGVTQRLASPVRYLPPTALRPLLGRRARAFHAGLAAPSFLRPLRCPVRAAVALLRNDLARSDADRASRASTAALPCPRPRSP